MYTLRLIFTVIMALVLTGCPPPVSDNPASGSNNPDAPAQSDSNTDNSASGSNNPDAPPPGDPEPKAIVLPRVSAGVNHSMIVKTDDTLWAVGFNNKGQLGDGSTASKQIPVAVRTVAEGPAMTEVDQISAGWEHTMILKKDDTLWAVGDNQYGQLGDGSTASKQIPIAVRTVAEGPAMTEVAQISAGSQHTVILKTNGELWAVGRNDEGQLGDGSTDSKQIPVAVLAAAGEPMIEVDQISAGKLHTMILKKNSSLWAVGLNRHGQLGDGTKASKQIPVAVKTAAGEPMTEVAQVSAGKYHSMILKKNGTVWATGINDYGQLGNGERSWDAVKTTPVAVLIAAGEPMTEVAQVSVGRYHSMILKTNGELWAVGGNNVGQLGDGNSGINVAELYPVQVKEIPAEDEPARVMTGVARISAGDFHTIIVKRDGTVWAVGKNENGQLGDGSTENKLFAVEITVE